MQAYLNTAVRAVRKAGSAVSRATSRAGGIHSSPNVWLEIAETGIHETEMIVSGMMAAAYPRHSVLSSMTSGANYERDPECMWYVVAVDGMANFMRGVPHYATCLVYVEKNIPQHAVIYDVVRDEIFTASRGYGAFVNNQRLRVSKTTTIDRSYVALDISLSHQFPWLPRLLAQSNSVLSTGSLALDIVYVAASRLDAVVTCALPPCLRYLASLMAHESGAIATDYKGNPLTSRTDRVIVSTPKILSSLLAIITPPASGNIIE